MENNITALLYRIKENIKTVESGDMSEDALDEVRSDFLDLLELIKLFLISERDSYYGYFMMNLQFRVNFYSDSIAGIKLNEFPPVFEANPLLLCKFTLKEIIFVVCHEIDHIVLNHPAEMVKSNPEKDPDVFYEFNLAADAAVNDRINREIILEKHEFMSQPDGVITSVSLRDMYDLGYVLPMESYAYYFDLIHGKERHDQKGDEGYNNGQDSMMSQQNEKDGVEPDEGSGSSARARASQTPDENENGRGSQQQIVTAANCGNLTDHNWEAGADEEDVTAAVKELVNASVGMMNEESRGLMPAFFMSQVKRINKPPVISWQTVLKKYVGTIVARKRKTRTRLDRRQPERFDISGAVDDKVLKIVVAVDTSGSVDDEMISRIFNEIFSILAKRKHDITVIECDAKIQRVYKAKNTSDIKLKVVGRGGTAFTPVIKYINKERYFRDALLIYFTDGYGEAEIPRPRTYRNMWVVIGGAKQLSVSEPYGAVLSL